MPYQPIENYGIIGNMRTVALVSIHGASTSRGGDFQGTLRLTYQPDPSHPTIMLQMLCVPLLQP